MLSLVRLCFLVRLIFILFSDEDYEKFKRDTTVRYLQ